MHALLAQSKIGVEIKSNDAEACKAEAGVKLVPDVLVSGGNAGLIEGFVASLMKPRNGQPIEPGTPR